MIIEDHKEIDKQRLELRMVVAGHNGMGDPDFYFCKVRCSRFEYNEGDHYALAERKAIENGFASAPLVSFDEHDTAGRHLFPLFNWKSASTFSV